MPEQNDQPSFEQAWDTFTEKDKETIQNFAVCDWKSGVSEGLLKGMDVDRESLNELIKRGVIETKPNWQFFQILADELRDTAIPIEDRMKADPFSGLNDDEREILRQYHSYSDMAKRKNEEPRYRLVDKNFHNHVYKTHIDD